MIIYLEYAADGRRGGEIFHHRLHSFLVKNFADVLPEKRYRLPLELTNPIKHSRFNLALVKKHRPNMIVVDVSSSFRNILAVRWMVANKKRVLVVIQGQRLSYRHDGFIVKWLARSCENYLLKHADIILTHSRFFANLARRKGEEYPQVVIAPLGVDPIPCRDVPSCSQAKDGPIKLLFVGECTPVKGLKPLIKALSMLKDIDIHLDIAGGYSPEDQYFEETQRIIERNGLENRLTFHGFLQRNDLERLYQECSIFVCPSLLEGYSGALAEAIGHGLPIVATTAGAIPEMVTDNVNALLVKPGDSQALGAAIAKLAADHRLQATMRKKNLEKAATLPTWNDFHQILQRELAPAVRNAIEH